MRAVRTTRRRRGRAGLAAGVVAALVLGASAALAASAGASVTSGTATGAAKEPVAKLAISADTVEIKRKDADDFKKAKDGASLREGDTVRTDATGHAEIQYGDDAYTRLDVDTTFRIDSLTDDQGNRQVEGSLEKGQTWNRTVALTESETFEQTGADATAAVEGTAFAVTCDTIDHCVFTAIVHNIQLTGADNEIKLLTPLDECDSESGDLCGDISKVSPEDLPQWITDNLLRDLLERGIDDGPLTGTVVVQGSSVTLVRTSQSSPPPASPTAPGAPTDVTASGGDGSATVSFSPPASDGGSPITGYTVNASGSGSSVSLSVSSAAVGTASPIVVTGLANGAGYTFTVTATNAYGTGPASAPSNEVIPTSVPGAPTAVSATRGNKSATVAFTPPTSDGGQTITSYTVTASGGGGTASGSGSPIEISGLTNGIAYTFTVTATNVVGTGPASAPSSPVTPATLPGAPTTPHAVLASYDSAQVSFGEPVSDGGAQITSYTVSASSGGSCVATAPATSCTVTGLSDTTTTFSVAATNAVGTGLSSAPSNAVTAPLILAEGEWLLFPSTVDAPAPSTGWEQPGFDDSSWTPADAPFGDPGSPVACPPTFPTAESPFPVLGVIYVRQTFELPDGATGVVLSGTVDNRAYVYINGHLIDGGADDGSFYDGYCHTGTFDGTEVPDEYLAAGTNLIAVQAVDEGSATFFTLTIGYTAPLPVETSDVGSESTGTPDEPEPTTTTTTPPEATEPDNAGS